ncbi:FMN-dependent dehydrogenase [Colletotrichum tofieldiae]|uniref:FMN-dependent dehydrogenase n=1 Tax=Colletotrichum tofieldiae TaxID=708197 RepID=A0A166RJ38_9PEZI|nr:FMN-dependent dehydrogenase [Colletotrichum tofieldiae]
MQKDCAHDVQYSSEIMQVLFQQIYVSTSQTENNMVFQQAEKTGAKALVLTADSAAPEHEFNLPIIHRGIQTAEDACMAVEVGAPAIFLSNHGGHALDGSPSPVEVAREIFEKDPGIFQKIELYADGCVRYGTNALELLALGVRAVGIGRPFMFVNVYGTKDVTRAIQPLKEEIATSAASL